MTCSFLRRDGLAVWICWSAWCAVAAWTLSALGRLDRAGFLVTTLLFLAALAATRRGWGRAGGRPLFLVRPATYARRLPRAWLALTVLALAGGVFYHPDNYDYLTYRFPRVLNWAAAHRWLWIDTPEDRQNISAVGMEWLMMPVFALFRTDRLFFLINGISYLFLPGLVFSVFRRLGIGGRVAWWWMWILPAGLCFVLQAAGMGNDAFAAVYLLAAFHYAFRADAGHRRALLLSILAIALVTGAKASNIPLVLPWLAILWLRRPAILAAARPGWVLGVCAAGLVCSFAPIALANIRHTGSYTGDPGNSRKLMPDGVAAGVMGNALEVASGALSPPIWPHVLQWPLQDRITGYLRGHGYPRFGLNTIAFEIEEVTGAGLGVTALALVGSFYGLAVRRRHAPGAWLFVGTTVVAWLGYLAKMGSEAAPRLVAPYYVVGIAALLLALPPGAGATHRLAWRGAGWFALACAFLLVILNPARPLLPPMWIGSAMRALHVPAGGVAQLEDNYRRRAERFDGLQSLRKAIPPAETIIGAISGGDDPEISLWLPFGSRRVVEVRPDETDLGARGIRYVVVSGATLQDFYHEQLPDLLTRWSATVEGAETRNFKTSRAPETWYLLHATRP